MWKHKHTSMRAGAHSFSLPYFGDIIQNVQAL